MLILRCRVEKRQDKESRGRGRPRSRRTGPYCMGLGRLGIQEQLTQNVQSSRPRRARKGRFERDFEPPGSVEVAYARVVVVEQMKDLGVVQKMG